MNIEAKKLHKMKTVCMQMTDMFQVLTACTDCNTASKLWNSIYVVNSQ
jgi:hypothetical protein